MIFRKTLLTCFFVFSFSSLSLASGEFNENEVYSGLLKSTYTSIALPLLPGEWKVDDIEKSGSVGSGNFYVYSTFIPLNVTDEDRRYNDVIGLNILGANSEETEYRKSFYGCEGGWYSVEGAIVNIDVRGSGDFEETCSVDQPDFQNMQFSFVDCSEICIELFFTLDRSSYKNDASSFKELSELFNENIRNIINGNGGSLEFVTSYRK